MTAEATIALLFGVANDPAIPCAHAGVAALEGLLLVVSAIVLVAAVSTDIKRWIVPNRMVLVVALIGIAARLLSAPEKLWISLAAAAIIFVGLGLLAAHDWIGGGDVKLIAAVSLLVPADQVTRLLLEIVFAGGAVSCAFLLLQFAIAVGLTPRRAPVVVAAHRRNDRAATETAFWRNAMHAPVPYSLAVIGGLAYHLIAHVVGALSAGLCVS